MHNRYNKIIVSKIVVRTEVSLLFAKKVCPYILRFASPRQYRGAYNYLKCPNK